MANSMILILELICLISSITITSSAFSSNETDLLALFAFKASINSGFHGALNSWNETSHFCSWRGITCGPRNNRVVGINLASEGLVGSLSPHIGNLSFLRSINLQNNGFNGYIPQEIGFLKRLEFLQLGQNSLVGKLPYSISQCSSLALLDLNSNHLTGVIPPEIGSLYKLRVLNLSRNTFSGSIPSSLGNLTSLTDISLSYSGFTGEIPESFARLQSLIVLQLTGNEFAGGIPAGVFNISTIETFHVASCGLQGTLPSNIGITLPNLRRFLLQENRFSGVLPVSLSNVTSIERIGLLFNEFTGPIPEKIGRLSNLQVFVITSNHFEGDIGFISSLTNCTNLTNLRVDNNKFTGLLPHSIANLSSLLRSFSIHKNQIYGEITSDIGKLGSLTRLTMSGNFLAGSIPVSMGNLANLINLDLGRNRFTGQIPYSLGNLTFLSDMSLGGNELFGRVPRSFLNLTHLLSMDLSHNNLNGSLPREIMHLSSISMFLNLSHNKFTGFIPSEVGLLTNLENLDLSNNRFSGLIPHSLGNCRVLQKLDLGGNSLHGEIPSELSALSGLLDLDLSRNNLSSTIPKFLSNLRLEHLDLSFNNLQGEVPTLGIFLNETRVSLEGNKDLCGGIADLKLPPCSSSVSMKKNFLKFLIPILVSGIICAALLICFIRFISMKKNSKPDSSSSVTPLFGDRFMRLTFADLSKATDGFSDDNMVGAGRFGSVYKGTIDDKMPFIAVKVLNLCVEGASKSFMAECNALRNLRHRNLLKILSICDSIDFHGDMFKALIYEYKANGSLEGWLHPIAEQDNEPGFKNLNFMQRLKIAIDVAHALEYLHWGTDSVIVHGDLKPSNILLDCDMTAYIGDFGLAKIISNMCPTQESSTSFGIKGTIGYVAPEYGTNSVMSTQGDVYSYGILLLEMFTKIRPTNNMLQDHINLHNFISNALPHRVMAVVDPIFLLGDDKHDKFKSCVTTVLRIGVACSRDISMERMSMIDVVQELHKIENYFHLQ